MMTPEQLVIELKNRGCNVSERTLRNWRTKGLLPPLSGRGRGRGLGVAQRWEDDEVLIRAMTVCDLLDRRARADDALLGLWFAGYEVNIKKTRKAWLSSLARTKTQWIGKIHTRENIEDALNDLSRRFARRFAGDYVLDRDDIEGLLSEALNAYFNQDSCVAVDDVIARTVSVLMRRNAKAMEGSELVTREDLERCLDFVRKKLSLGAMQRLIFSVTGKELNQAHLRWRSAIQTIRFLSAKANGGEISEEWAQIGRQSASAFGGLCIFALLYFERDGKGPWIDSWVDRIAFECHNLSLNPTGVVN